MKQTFSAGGVVLNQRGDIIIVNQKGTSWSLPKGHIEKDEDTLAAAKREIYEETGITAVTFIKELGQYSRHPMGKNNEDDKTETKTITMYLFSTLEEELAPVDPDNPTAQWVTPIDAICLLTHEKDKEFLHSIVSQLQ